MRPGGAGVSRKSEDDLASKLQDATWARSQNLTITRIIRVVPHRRSDSSAGERIITILVMVERIERLGPELECHPLAELEVLSDADVPVVYARATDYISSAVAELSVESLAERHPREAGV